MKTKNSLFLFICALFLGFMIVMTGSKIQGYAINENTIVLENNDTRLSNDYLDFYSVPSSYFTYSNNGGNVSGYELSKAFDRNFSTSFKSAQDNNVSYVDPDTNETKSNFINIIDVEFSSKVSIDRILYASENGTTRGYPTNLNLYYDSGDGFKLIKNYQSTETTKFVVFEFGETIQMNKFRFEYIKVSTNHKYVASAKEIIFLQPENEDYELYKNIFTDYAETKLSDKLNSIEKINAFESRLNYNVNFTESNSKIERAKKILNGEISFNSDFEFSTGATTTNKIERYGNLESYCRNTLQLSSFGTNRQVIGVSANAGDEINIYVTGNENDPLPKIRFSQHMGHWRSWMGGEIQLSLGKNTFTVPSFYHSDYSIDVVLGGPIYICNPYTEEEQSSNVKLYIEGGTLYPVLRASVDEEEYKSKLKKYCDYINENPEIAVNVTEIVSDHCIATVDATVAYSAYQNFSPSQAINNWNSYMDKLLEFAGIPQDESNELFDERNLHIIHNIRVVQPWPGGFMFAAGEHIGVLSGSQGALIYASGFGWGVSHEIGHTLDNKNRVIGETTNNMWAKYNETAIENTNTRGNFDQTLQVLSNDLTYDNTNYFVEVSQNYLIWWYIEAWQKGFWGRLENCYRGKLPKLVEFWTQNPDLKSKANSLTPTELQVFYASISTGVDLSYYFDRWGYSIRNTDSDPVFKIETASSEFNEIMNVAINSNFIDNTKQYKLWYQNYMQYHVTNTTPIYSNSSIVSINSVTKTSNGYNIFIEQTKNENHLGFEILEGNDENGYNVIGFTYYSSFVDTTTYDDGYIPNYKIVAIDNTFNSSSTSESKTIEECTKIICKIGENSYTSLLDAVSNSTDGDIIEIIDSFSTINITIDKNLTIMISSSVKNSIVISKIESGDLFNIESSVTLKIYGSNSNYLVIDGNDFNQTGTIFNISGIVNAEYLKLQNCISNGNGGAILLQNNSKGSTFKNCIFDNITAKNGAIVYCGNASSNITFTNCNFINNRAENDGIIKNKATVTLSYCEVKNNTSKANILSNFEGGILKIYNCQVTNNTAENHSIINIDGYTEIKNCDILNNTSNAKSTIYYNTGVAVRQLILDNVNFSNNKSPLYKDIIIEKGKITLSNTVCSDFDMYLMAGEIKINSNCNLNGNITIKNGANLIIANSIDSILNITFNLEDYVNNMHVFACENFSPSSDDLSQIKIKNDDISLKISDNIVIANNNTLSITIKNGEPEILKKYYNYGETVVLNFDLFDTKYIGTFTSLSGITYSFNDSFSITNDEVFDITLLNKIKIEFETENNAETIYCLPNAKVTLPAIKLDKIKHIGWQCDNVIYNEGDEIVATKDQKFIAKFVRIYKLTVKNGDTTLIEKEFESGSQINLNELVDNIPDYWTENGERIDSTIVISKDTIVTANYIQRFKLTIKNGDQVIFEREFESGSQINLNELVDNIPDYWTENGERIDSTIVISKDTIVNTNYKSDVKKYKLTIVSKQIVIFNQYYEAGTSIDLEQLNVAKPNYWSFNGHRIDKNITINEDMFVFAKYLYKLTIKYNNDIIFERDFEDGKNIKKEDIISEIPDIYLDKVVSVLDETISLSDNMLVELESNEVSNNQTTTIIIVVAICLVILVIVIAKIIHKHKKKSKIS